MLLKLFWDSFKKSEFFFVDKNYESVFIRKAVAKAFVGRRTSRYPRE